MSCRWRSSRPSIACWQRRRRSARSPRCARSAAMCIASPSAPPMPAPAGWRKPMRGRRPARPTSRRSISRRWSSTPCRRRRRRCSTTARSTSNNGSRTRCRSCSPSRKAPPSSTATAPPSRRASSATPIVADASGPGAILVISPAGAAGAFASSNPTDALVDLAYAPKQAYRANGTWVMNRKTESRHPQVQGLDRQLHLAAGHGCGPAGHAVRLSRWRRPRTCRTSRPTRYAIAFGDFARGYLVVDRVGIRVLRDPYSAKPYVLFYTTKRVGGGVQNFEAIKLMKFATS